MSARHERLNPFALLEALGVLRAARALTSEVPRVLMYHRFGASGNLRRTDAALFEEHLVFLKRYFEPMTISQLVDGVRGGRSLKNAVVITVDDCYSDFYTHAWPLLKRLAVPATIYAVTKFVSNEIWLWPDELRYIIYRSEPRSLKTKIYGEDVALDMRGDAARERTWESVADYCLTLTNDKRISFIEQLANALSVQVPAAPTEDFVSMSWAQLSEVAATGIEIGSHTLSHPRLTSLPREEVHRELAESKATIEQNLGIEVRSFCYPNGTHLDYNDEIKRCVQACGYDNAVVAGQESSSMWDHFAVGRIGVPEDMPRFRTTMSGLTLIRGLRVSRKGSLGSSVSGIS